MSEYINAQDPKTGDPEWLDAAFQELDTREISGPVHNSRVLEYHACTGLGATDDETPWCSSFICWVMTQCGLTSTRSAASLSWLRWGRALDKPRRGAVTIFERVDGNGQVIPNRGHVALYLYEKQGFTYVLGGNQGNRVKVSAFPTARVIGYRWPSRPLNSTTNKASATAAVGTLAAAAPTVLSLVEKLTAPESAEKVTQVVDTAQSISTQMGIPLSSGVAMLGLAVALAAMVYVIRERNQKIKEFGI